MSNEIRLIDITVGELLDMVEKRTREVVQEQFRLNHAQQHTEMRQYERGLEGIMKIYGCSKSTAYRIKRDGLIKEAIRQITPKIFVIDRELALSYLPKA